jgi:hypothetical protein
MAKVKGVLKYASAPTLTAAGKKSEARAVDPQDTVVEVESKAEEQSVLKSVKAYCKAMADEKAAKKAAEEQAEILRAYVGELRSQNAVQGDYQKTYRVVGEKADKLQYQVDVSQADKWGPRKDVDLKALRLKVGVAAFDAVAEEDTTISIKDEILKNRSERVALSKALEAALGVEGIKKYFSKETVWVVKEGMEKAQYSLPADQKTALAEGFKQVADSVKDSSQKV